MLTGKRLGDAIKKAIDLKMASGAINSKTEIAKHFGVKLPSIYDWTKKGSISKDKLPKLFVYFSDVVSAQHWGLTKEDYEYFKNTSDGQTDNQIRQGVKIYEALGIDPSTLTIEQIDLLRTVLKIPLEDIPHAKKVAETYVDPKTGGKGPRKTGSKNK